MSSTLAAGITLGGVTISSLGAASTYMLEKKQPTVKSIVRDFIIGCVLVLMLLQLLPDSASSIAGFVASFTKMVGGNLTSMSDAGPELEIQVGPPGF